MKIDEAINETIIAIYRDPRPSVPLFLKGGSAMRLWLLPGIDCVGKNQSDLSAAPGI